MVRQEINLERLCNLLWSEIEGGAVMKRKPGDIVVTIFGWAGVIDKIYDSKNGKQKYRVIDEDCHPHIVSENAIVV